MGLFDFFKKKEEERPAPPPVQPEFTERSQAQPEFTADELLEQGQAYQSQGDMEAAFRAYVQAGEKGNTLAMHRVAQSYLYKYRGAPFDLKKSAEWYEKAAKAGFIPSMMMLSQCYIAGAGVPESDEICKQWLERALEAAKQAGETKTIEIATRRLNDMAGHKRNMKALYATATEMGGIPPKN